MSKKPDTITIALNPRLKVAELPVKFRDSKGRFCKPSKGASYEVTPPGKRKPIKGEIPKESRKSVSSRKTFIAQSLIAWSKIETGKQAKTYRQKVKAQLEVKKQKPVSKAETKRRNQLKERTKAALEKEGFKTPPPSTPRLYERVTVSPPTIEKFVQRSGVHHDPRHADSREGPQEFKKRELHIIKKKVEFDPSNPVELYSFNAKATAISMREFLTPHAIKFLDEMRNDTENAYIFRVETRNRVEGEAPTREGIGTERFRVRDHIPKRDLAQYKKQYPGMTQDQILRELQIQDLTSEMGELFTYFIERYQDYLSKQVVSSMAVTGFSMEVVKGVMT
jgi:hypothetical protein